MPHSFRDRRAFVTRPRIDDCDRTPAGRNAGGASTRKPRRTRPLVLAVRCVSRSGIGPHEAFLSPCRWLSRVRCRPTWTRPIRRIAATPNTTQLRRQNDERCKTGRISLSPPSIARVSHPRTRSSFACPQVTITAGSGQHKAHRLFGPLPPRPSGPTPPPNLGTITHILLTDALSTA